MPAGSKLDLPLAKAKPVRDGVSASVIAYLRRGKRPLKKRPAAERGVGCERNSHADTEVSEEGEGGGVPEQRFHCSPSLQPMEG